MTNDKIILEFLNDNDNGRFIDVSVIDLDYNNLKLSVESLSGRNLIVIDKSKPRNFEAFGISNNRNKKINVKINSRGKEYLHCLNKSNGENCEETKKKRAWKLAFFFG